MGHAAEEGPQTGAVLPPDDGAGDNEPVDPSPSPPTKKGILGLGILGIL